MAAYKDSLARNKMSKSRGRSATTVKWYRICGVVGDDEMEGQVAVSLSRARRRLRLQKRISLGPAWFLCELRPVCPEECKTWCRNVRHFIYLRNTSWCPGGKGYVKVGGYSFGCRCVFIYTKMCFSQRDAHLPETSRKPWFFIRIKRFRFKRQYVVNIR